MEEHPTWGTSLMWSRILLSGSPVTAFLHLLRALVVVVVVALCSSGKFNPKRRVPVFIYLNLSMSLS